MTARRGTPLVLDATIVTAFLDSQDPHHGRAVDVLRAHAGVSKLMNTLNFAEVLVAPTRHGRARDAVDVMNSLRIQQVGIPDDAAVRLAIIRAETGSKMPDCCVLLTAEQRTAAVATFDRRLQESARQLGIPLA